MKNLFVLVKSIFINSFRSEGKKKGQLSNLLGMLISGGVFAVMFAGTAVFMGPIFAANGLIAEFLSVIFLASQLIVLIFGTVVMVNIMFFSKDAEMLLYLPIKPVTIFASKMIYVYLTELMLSAFMVAVTGTVFGIVCGFTVPYFLLLVVALFFVPMVPLIIAALLCVPIMYVISFFKNKSLLSTVLLIAVFGAIMYFYLNFVGGINDVDENFSLPVDQLKTALGYMLPNIALARIVTLTSTNYLLDVFYVFIFTAGLFGIALLISSFTYRRGMASQLEEAKTEGSGELKFERSSIIKSIILKDTKEILRNPGFAFYCLFQIFLVPIFIAFYGTMLTGSEDNMPLYANTGMSFFFTVLMVVGMNYTAMSSISREGANFNMTKTFPVPYSIQIRAKIYLANIVTAAGVLLSFAAMIVVLRTDILQYILFSGFAIILGGAFNSLLIYLDAKSPKLDWDSITMALKNSKAAFVSMGLSMAVGLPLFIGYMLLSEMIPANLYIVAFAAFWAVFYAVAVVLYAVFKKMLENNAERLITEHE